MFSDTLEYGLTGTLLVAMPAMVDPTFRRAVVLVCAHSPAGAMGLMVNRPASDMTLRRLFSELGLDGGEANFATRIRLGGPAEGTRGFVLHSPDYDEGAQTLRILPALRMTGSRTLLSLLGRGEGPVRHLLTMGYCGWGPGQLEAELSNNIWLTANADTDLIFDQDDALKWKRAVADLGISLEALSNSAGHA